MAGIAGPRVIHGSAQRMREVADASAALVLTSPPFFSAATESRLRVPVREQRDFDGVGREVMDFALHLRPAFDEIARVLAPGGHLVLETKDLRYGGALISLSAVHRELAEACGLRLTNRVLWQNSAEAPHHGSLARVRADLQAGRGFRTVDTEEFLVFLKPGAKPRLGLPEAIASTTEGDLHSPLWKAPPSRSWHPHASPAAVVRRFVALFSRPGDLVIDPFAGSGMILRVAAELGRVALGYEIDRAHWQRAAKGLS